MNSETEKEILQFMGKIDERTKNIVDRLDGLPCGDQFRRIEALEDYKNQMMGRVSIISLVCGIVGYGISVAITWLLKK